MILVLKFLIELVGLFIASNLFIFPFIIVNGNIFMILAVVYYKILKIKIINFFANYIISKLILIIFWFEINILR